MNLPANNRIRAEYKLPSEFINQYAKVEFDYIQEHMNRQLMQKMAEELLSHKSEAIQIVISPSPIGVDTTVQAELYVFTRKELEEYINRLGIEIATGIREQIITVDNWKKRNGL